MLVSHVLRHHVLYVTLHQELDVTTRAAAALQIQSLAQAHRPARVVLLLPGADPTPATLSVLARTRRVCGSLRIPLVPAGASARTRRLLEATGD